MAARWALVVALLVYALSLALFYPDAITVADEGSYVRQARLVVEGRTTFEKTSPFTGEPLELQTSVYPVGTALMLAPFVAAAGWKGAFAGAAFYLAAGVLLTATWLRAEGRSALFALIPLGFPAALVLGRVGMSDVPSMAWVAAGLLCFWRGLDRPRTGWWLASGFVAGASLLLREGNVLLFAPLFAGALLRRDAGVWALVVGGLAGVGARLLGAWLSYGDPLFYKSVEGFAADAARSNLPLHALALLVFVPGGLVGGLLYRGRRREELVATVAIFALFYLVYTYSGAQSSFAKRIVLGQRFFIPLLPLLAFTMAESFPRLTAGWRAGAGARVWPWAVRAWVLGVVLLCAAVHPVHARWSGGQAAIRDAILGHTSDGAILVTNVQATAKFIDLLYGDRLPLHYEALDARHIDHLASQNDEVYLVLLDRSDSEAWRRRAARAATYVAFLGSRLEPVFDQQMSPTDRLRIWRIRDARGPRSPARRSGWIPLAPRRAADYSSPTMISPSRRLAAAAAGLPGVGSPRTTLYL